MTFLKIEQFPPKHRRRLWIVLQKTVALCLLTLVWGFFSLSLIHRVDPKTDNADLFDGKIFIRKQQPGRVEIAKPSQVVPKTAYDLSSIVYGASSSSSPDETLLKFAVTPHEEEFSHQQQQEVGGVTYKTTGKIDRVLVKRHLITTSLVHNFQPPPAEFLLRIAKPGDENVENVTCLAKNPALFWDQRYDYGERLLVVAQLQLGYDRENGSRQVANFLFAETFDPQMQTLVSGRVVLIPKSGDSAGPAEPRLFTAFNATNIFILFNRNRIKNNELTKSSKKTKKSISVWNLANNKGYRPIARNPSSKLMTENWMPFNLPSGSEPSSSVNMTYFVDQLNPLRVLECTPAFECDVAFKQDQFANKPNNRLLQGGTPFVAYQWPYYIALARGVHSGNNSDPTSQVAGYSTAHFVVLWADPKSSPPYHIVYVSESIIDLGNNNKILQRFSDKPNERPSIFPVGLIVENRDSALVGVGINEKVALLLRIRGLEKIMNDVIALGSSQNDGLSSSTLLQRRRP